MKAIRITLTLVTFALISILTASCASVPTVPFSRQPHDLPDDAFVDAVRLPDGGAVVGVLGVKIVRVEIYKRNYVYQPETRQEGEWTHFNTESTDCFNFIFWDPKDEKNHFVLVTERDNELPPKWLGPWILVTKDRGQGSCMAVRKNRRE